MTDETMSDEQRLKEANDLSTQFVNILEAKYKVEESVIAILMPVAKGTELRVRVNGSSFGIINMVSAVVQQLIPSDFDTLLDAMQNDAAFHYQRNHTPLDKRHVN